MQKQKRASKHTVKPKSRISLNDAKIVEMVETIKTYVMADVSTTAIIRMALRKYITDAEKDLLK